MTIERSTLLTSGPLGSQNDNRVPSPQDEALKRMPGAGAPSEDEAEGEGDGTIDDAARKMDERDQRI